MTGVPDALLAIATSSKRSSTVSIPLQYTYLAELSRAICSANDSNNTLQMQPQVEYSQPYGQPGYTVMPGSLQNGDQQQVWSESNVPSTQAQYQMTQQTNGQHLQQSCAQQAYGQEVQSVQAYSQQPVYPPYSHPGVQQGVQQGFQQTSGQQGIQQGAQQGFQQGVQPGVQPGVQQVFQQMPGQQGVQPAVQQVFQPMPGQQVVQAPAAIVGAQYCAQGEQIFFVNEKWASLSKDDFSILDSQKQPVFRMDSSAFSVKQKRVLKTRAGKAVCSLKKKLLSGSQPTWYLSLGATASDKERVAVIKKDTYNGAHSASLFLNSNTTQYFSQPVPDYQARGDVKNRSFFIYRGAMPVAEIMRSVSISEKVTRANHYVLRVSHGTDCALMIAFCVVIDELFND